MQHDYLTFSQWVRERRQALHLTQQQLGALAFCATETIRKIEADLRRPSPKVALLLAQALQLPPEGYGAFVSGSRSGVLDLPPLLDTSSPLVAPSGGSRPTETTVDNLPVVNSSLVGRADELATLQPMLAHAAIRLVTLTGPGGVGKTRLAIAAATAMRAAFPDGRLFVSLASIGDPALVLPTLAQVLGVKERAGTPLLTSVQAFLRPQAMLLVLDNFEQVMPACLTLADLLGYAPRLTLLVTSRAPLHLVGEHVHAVHPLSAPPQPAANLAAMEQYTAVRLFIERAHAVKADVRFDDRNAEAVAQICARLDGLPLAIELAAARMVILPPHALLQRLGSPLQMLTGGAHDLPLRHQTLRAMIDWSYSLLDPAEQMLFAYLAVFVGSFSLEAAEALHDSSTHPPAHILNGIQTLIDKSLLQQLDDPQDEPQFGMLQTIHEYAFDRLAERDDADVVHRRHALYYLRSAEAAEAQLTGADQQAWLQRLEKEHDNLRATLRWALQQQHMELALRLCSAVARFWWTHGYLHEGRNWLKQALDLQAEGAATLRARALYWSAILANAQGDYAGAEQALNTSLALTEQAGDRFGVGMALNALGMVANARGDHAGACQWYEQGLALYRALNDDERVATLLHNLGFTKLLQYEFGTASSLLEASLQLSRDRQDRHGMAFALNNLGLVALRKGDWARAHNLLLESLTLFWELRDQRNIAEGLEGLGELAMAQGNPVRAAHLLAAAGALRTRVGATHNVYEQRQHAATLAAIHALLSEAEVIAALGEGKALSLAAALRYAFDEE